MCRQTTIDSYILVTLINFDYVVASYIDLVDAR